MNALRLCIAAATQQFLTFADRDLLSDRAKTVMTTVALSLAASAVVAPTPAQAQVWAGQSAAAMAGSPVLSQSSAGRWGDLLGSSLGRVLGASVGGSSNSELGRRMQDVVGGVSEEVGRNVGRRAAESPYQGTQQQQQTQVYRGAPAPPFAQSQYIPQQVVASNQAYSVPIAVTGQLLPAQRTMVHHQDNLDLLALKAVVANDDLAWARLEQADARTLDNFNARALTNFELGLRSAQQQGLNVQPWMAARSALLLPVGSLPQTDFEALGRPFVERLNRPDGPGVAAVDLHLERQVADLRALNVQRQQSSVRSMPIENFGR